MEISGQEKKPFSAFLYSISPPFAHLLQFNFLIFALVKILATTFLSIIFLFQSSGPVMDWCCELLKIPNLVEHFNEQTEDSGIGFIDFLDYHYGNQKDVERHKDDGHDGELPLQGHHGCSHGFSFVNSEAFELIVIEPFEDRSTSIFYQPLFSSASFGRIFQPPRYNLIFVIG